MLGKTLTIFLCGLSVALFALLFPIATNLFDERLSLHQWLLAFVVHIELTLLGMLIPLYLHWPFVSNGSLSIALAMLILILSVAKDGIAKETNGIHWLWWVLPPVSQPVNLLANADADSPGSFTAALIRPLVYFSALFLAYVYWWERKR